MRAKFIWILAALFLCLLCIGNPLLAQSTQGSISGLVSDAQGSGVPGAEVVARNLGTNLSFRAPTSQDGSYTLPILPIGDYEVTATSAGFKTFVRSGIRLEVSQRLRLDIALGTRRSE
ncbi:MAG: carboxypeptidase-like regulatory domain-containing protein [Bryobacterales bacterium]|nr:carboxypeptidase-like regulatory domain-containing protein [Bryobacterales bacterium]